MTVINTVVTVAAYGNNGAPMRPIGTEYRRDIDGLRAIAVGAVVAYHAYPGRITGGFTGVDVFFVISGYLITGIISRRVASGDFSIKGFYAARARRILPALLVVLLATLLVGWFTLLTFEFKALGRQIVASSAFAANILFWNEARYFDPEAIMKPLLHLWSLGVEEQFYIAWPIAIIALASKGKVRSLALGVAAISFAYALWMTIHSPTAAFFSPLTRTWELMIGAALAGFAAPSNRLSSNALGIIGLALLGASFFLISSAAPFPGWRALLPVFGAAFLISAGPEGAANRVIGNRIFVYGGLISYPLYLWHWPIFSISAHVYGDVPKGIVKVGLIALATVLAALTYHLIEANPRVRRHLTPARLFLGLAIMAALGAITAFSGLPGRAVNRDERWAFLASYERLHRDGLNQTYRYECDFRDPTAIRQRTSIDSSCTQRGTRGTFMLWGDSHAQALSGGLRAGLPSGYALAQVATSGCRPQLPYDVSMLSDSCRASTKKAWQTLKEIRPSIIFLAQRKNHSLTDWEALALEIKAVSGAKVVLVGPMPEWLPSLPRTVTSYHWRDGKTRFAEGLDRQILATDKDLSTKYHQSPYLRYVSLVQPLCNEGGCLGIIDRDISKGLIAVDYGHLTPLGSAWVVSNIVMPAIRPPAR